MCHLTSLWSVEGNRVTIGPIALLVENTDSKPVLGERFEPWHDGMSPFSRERHGLPFI